MVSLGNAGFAKAHTISHKYDPGARLAGGPEGVAVRGLTGSPICHLHFPHELNILQEHLCHNRLHSTMQLSCFFYFLVSLLRACESSY